MRMKFSLAIFTIFFGQLIHAQNEDSLILEIDQIDISSLSSPKEHKAFFKLVWDLDQGIRKSEMNVVAEDGYGSHKHDSILKIWESVDLFAFNKMREYLSVHPFPSREKYNALPSLTIVTVFHHAAGTPENIDLKKMYFPTFFKAYEDGNVYSGDIWMFLYRLYQQVKQEVYVNQELGEEEQIVEMIDLLELNRKKPN